MPVYILLPLLQDNLEDPVSLFLKKGEIAPYFHRERDLAIVSLILSSGLRVSEVVTLTIDKIDWENRRILIKRKSERRPLLQRNVMAKLDLTRSSQDVETKAAIIEHKILSSDEQIEDFRNFVAGGFAKIPKLSKKQLSWLADV